MDNMNDSQAHTSLYESLSSSSKSIWNWAADSLPWGYDSSVCRYKRNRWFYRWISHVSKGDNLQYELKTIFIYTKMWFLPQWLLPCSRNPFLLSVVLVTESQFGHTSYIGKKEEENIEMEPLLFSPFSLPISPRSQMYELQNWIRH